MYIEERVEQDVKYFVTVSRQPWSGRLGGNMRVVSPWIYRGYYMAAQRCEISL